MGVKEVDHAFATMIDMSAELLNIGKPRVDFAALKPVKLPEPRVEIDFELVADITSSNSPVLEKEYLPLFMELKRFEPRSLIFSSIEPAQGVSFTARNIAKLWAKSGDMRILLLEFYNGFSGSIYDNTADENAEVFEDSQLLEDYLVYLPEDNLYFYSVHAASITTGLEEFWERVSSSFDLIIIDAAPKGFNVMTDQLAGLATGVVMISVQKPDPVKVQVFEREIKEEGGRFLGVIMNAID